MSSWTVNSSQSSAEQSDQSMETNWSNQIYFQLNERMSSEVTQRDGQRLKSQHCSLSERRYRPGFWCSLPLMETVSTWLRRPDLSVWTTQTRLNKPEHELSGERTDRPERSKNCCKLSIYIYGSSLRILCLNLFDIIQLWEFLWLIWLKKLFKICLCTVNTAKYHLKTLPVTRPVPLKWNKYQ